MNTSAINKETTNRLNRIIRASSFSEALSLVSQDAACFVEVFVAAWPDVDLHRAKAESLGLAGRIGIHHRSALESLVRLQVFTGTREDPPAPPMELAGLNRLLHNFVRAASALAGTRISFHRKALS